MHIQNIKQHYGEFKQTLFDVVSKPLFRIKSIKTLWDSIHDDTLLPWWCRGRYECIQNILKFKRMCIETFVFKIIGLAICYIYLFISPYEIIHTFCMKSFNSWFLILMYPTAFFAVRLGWQMMAEQYNELVYKRNTDKWLLHTKRHSREITNAEFEKIVMSDPEKYYYTHVKEIALGIAHFNPVEREDWNPLTEPDDPETSKIRKSFDEWHRKRNKLENDRYLWELEKNKLIPH